MAFDPTAEALRIHSLMYTLPRATQAEGLRSYHPSARFADPLVGVEGKRAVAIQFGAFESVFASVRYELHGAGELHRHAWPVYVPPDAFSANSKVAAVDSTQYYRPLFHWMPEIAVRVWTIYQFTPVAGEGWLVTRHEDSWAIDSAGAMVPAGLRVAVNWVRDAWSRAFTWGLEVFLVRGRAGERTKIAKE